MHQRRSEGNERAETEPSTNRGGSGPEAWSALLTPKLLARRWHMSHRTLERWRASGVGPPAVRLGNRYLYRVADVERYEQEHLLRSEVDA